MPDPDRRFEPVEMEGHMRRVLSVLAAIALIALSAAPALAARPEKEPDVIGDPLTFPAGEVCDFDLRETVKIDTGKSIVFPPEDDGAQRVLVNGHIVATVTNLETDQSVTYNISGPGTFTYGDTLEIDATGTWLFYNFEGDAGGPGMWLSTGKSHLEIDLATGQWLSFTPARNTIDVCAVLGGSGA